MLRKKINFKLGSPSSTPSGAKRLARSGYLIPGAAIGLLGSLSIATLHPILPSEASADEVNVAAILTPSITLSMNSSVSESIEPTVDGSFKNIATVARVQVMNSDYYDISISGNPDMAGVANPDAKIAAISGDKTQADFTANTWGYAASKNATNAKTPVVATSSTVYKPIPSTSTQIIAKQNTTNHAADDYYSLNFGAKVDTSIPADTYTSRVTLSVTASPINATEYSLTYNANGGAGTPPAKQVASSYEKNYEFTVASGSGSMTRNGYTFLGWADSASATTAQYTAGSKITVPETSKDKVIYAVWKQNTSYSITYNGNSSTGGTVPTTQSASHTDASQEFTVPSETPTRTGYIFLGWAESSTATSAIYVAGSKITLTTSKPTMTLYAVWRKNIFGGITTMQGLTSDTCRAATVGDTVQLSDTRDNRSYWIAKLPDGNCWMTQNIDYAIPNSTLNLGTKKTADNAWFWENGLKVMGAPISSTATTIDSTWTASTDVDFYTKNGNSAVNSSTKTYDAHFLMGNYYQYSAAAKACPSGWALPTANQAVTVNGSYNKLANGQSVNSLLAKPYFFIYSGGVEGYSGNLNSVGTYGYFWSSTYTSTSGYGIYILNTGIDAASAGGKTDGYPVRCYVNGN